jgi:hypothetical protein
MPDYRKIDALSKDTERAGALARYLLSLDEISWTDWELDFLTSLASRTRPLNKTEQGKLKKLEEKLGESLSATEAKSLAALRDVLTRSEQLTLRQAEKLAELEEASQRFTTVEGFNVRALIVRCAEAACDLDEDDEAFITQLKSSGAVSVRRRQLRKLLAIARQLGVIEDYVGGSMDQAARVA